MGLSLFLVFGSTSEKEEPPRFAAYGMAPTTESGDPGDRNGLWSNKRPSCLEGYEILHQLASWWFISLVMGFHLFQVVRSGLHNHPRYVCTSRIIRPQKKVTENMRCNPVSSGDFVWNARLPRQPTNHSFGRVPIPPASHPRAVPQGTFLGASD